MAIIKSFSPFQNLSNFSVFLDDTNPNSEYFRITEFQETFTGGKNGFLIEGSEFLKPTTEVKLELLDVEGNPIFFIPGDGIPEYYEGVSKLVSVHVYEDTPIGQGKITILGELERYTDDQGIEREVPDEWKGVYNVKWERTFRVNKNLNNETIVRFVNRPQVQIDEILKPFFTKQIPQITQTGTASGIGENPPEGTNLTGYSAGTLYRLAITDGSNFTSSVDENIITFPNLGYSSTVKEVLNNKEVLVDVPYTENNIVTNFQDESYTTTFEDLENQTTTDSALTGSFAKVKLNRLKTFVGDVARVKVFRKSRNEVGDFQLVQDARIESTELLRDIAVQDDTEVFYGNFTQNILDTYWISGSDDHAITLDDSKLFGGIQIDYNEGVGGTQTFITSESFQIEDDVEYTLSFKTLFDGVPSTDKNIRVLLSGSNYEQVISTTIPSASFNTRQNISQNFIATTSSLDTKLQFEFVGSDWYISKVSLKNAQETSFSPDELTLIQGVPRRLPQETFDFRFEFYDVNNNFIPVSVTATKEFIGGNDFRTEQKLLTFESDRTAFRFLSGSLGNPEFQQIRFTNTIQNLTGSVLYTSQAFDVDGNLITSESYHDSGVLEYPSGFSGSYPGLLQNPSNAGALLPIANFSGSVSGVTIGSIIYTASLEGIEEFETIVRFEDGEDAPALIVTSNTNQFIYEPTQLRPKPLGQEVRIRAQRKNLASLIVPIEVNSGSGAPPLVEGVDVNGIKNYSLSATSFSSSFAGQNGSFPEVTYEFTSSDEFNNEFTDEITVSPVINFDGLSVILSNEMTSFRANSQGLVLDNFESGDGEVEVRIGENVIQHSDGLSVRNSFDVVGSTPTNVTEKNGGTYPDETYGITALAADSGSIILDIKYLAGDNETSQSFIKKVNYTKNRISPPAILIDTENRNQNVEAKSNGSQLGGFEDSTITVQQIYTGSVDSLSNQSITITNTPAVSVDTSSFTTNGTISFGNLPSGTNSTIVNFTINGEDSEGGSRSVSDSISLSKSRKASPSIVVTATPQSQTVSANSGGVQTGTLTDVDVDAREGSTSRFDSMSINSTTGFSSNPTVSGNTLIMSSATMNNTDASVTLGVNYTDSEGNGGSQNITINSSLSIEGDKGDAGPSGSNGDDGLRTAQGIVHYQLESLNAPDVPSADSFNFSTGQFSNLTNNWGINAPTYNTGNSNKYWFSVYTAVETSPGSGVGNVSFGNVTQAIGFTGLVTFTSGDSVDDGLGNELSFGIDGATAIHGDNIATGRIISTNFDGIGGDGYANAGMEFDLDNNEIIGTHIQIKDGSAKFKGDLQAAGGTFTGTLSGVDGNFSGDVTANTLTANNSGTIGGFSIGSTTLTGGSITLDANTPRITLGTGNELVTLDGNDSTYRLWVGNSGPEAAPFAVRTDGSIQIDSNFIDIVNSSTSNVFRFGDYQITDSPLGTQVAGSSTLLYNPEIPGENGVPLRVALMDIVDFKSSNVPVKTGFYIETTGQGPPDDDQERSENPTAIQIIPKRYNAGIAGTDDNWYLDQTLKFQIENQGADAYWQFGGPLRVTGNITAFASSDKRLKDNIIPITKSLDKINKLSGYEFDWNDKQTSFKGKDIGLIAQEVQEVYPMLVGEQNTGYLGVRYEKLVPLLVQGIKELTQRVEELEKEVGKS